MNKKINGALVDNFNVYGSIQGQSASIYIANNAYVKNINIYDGAYLKGNIINNWDPDLSDYRNFVDPNTLYVLDGIKNAYTNLNFKEKSNNKNIIIDGNIIGTKALKIVNDTNTTINGYALVHDFTNNANIYFTGANLDGLALYVTNELILTPDSNLGLNFNSDGKIQNKIAVGANANVNGGLILNASQDFYASNHEYIVNVDSSNIIEAPNINGNFDSNNIKVITNSNILDFNIVNSANNFVTINVKRKDDAYLQYAYDFTTTNVANAIALSAQDYATKLADIIAYLDFTNIKDAQNTLSKLSATDYDINSYINLQHLDFINNTIRTNYLENRHTNNDVWIRSFYTNTNYDDAYNFDYNSYGFVLGAKLITNDHIDFALNLGASNLEADIKNSKQSNYKSNSALLGFNLNLFNFNQDLSLLLSVNYMYSDVNAKRSFYIAENQYNQHADFNAHAFLNSITLSKDINFDTVNLNLYTSLDYNCYYHDSFKEKGSASALKLSSDHEYNLPLRFGSNIEYSIISNKSSSLDLIFDGALK